MHRRLAELPWDDVRVFLAVARARGLSGAAGQLQIDKATVSRRLAGLERWLGARLFLRTREGLTPSATGQRLLPHAEGMEHAARGLTDAVVDASEARRERVRLATTEALGARLVRSGLLALCDAHPQVELELLGGNRPVDLLSGEAELALRFSPPTQRSLRARIVARIGFGLYASPDYLRRRGTPVSAGQLEGHDVLVQAGELGHLPESRWLAARPGVRVKLRSSSMPALMEAARAGHGLTVLTRAWGDSVPDLDRVALLPNLAARPVWLLTRPGEPPRGAVRLVADRVTELMGALARA